MPSVQLSIRNGSEVAEALVRSLLNLAAARASSHIFSSSASPTAQGGTINSGMR
jgi:hypothetical protein